MATDVSVVAINNRRYNGEDRCFHPRYLWYRRIVPSGTLNLEKRFIGHGCLNVRTSSGFDMLPDQISYLANSGHAAAHHVSHLELR